MRPPSTVLRHACALLSTVLLAALLVTASGAPPARDLRATSGSTYLCSGYAGCRNEGYSDAGYGAVNDRSYWNMYPGHNCTNYVAYRMIRAGMSAKRPFGYPGNATNWGDHLSDKVDQTPRVGAVAWWRAHDNGSGSAGHVAYVEKVTSDHIVISEDSWGGTFHWRRIDRSSYRWPTGFIHLIDRAVAMKERPRVTGTPQVGETLRVTDGQWDPSDVTLRFQWFVDGERVVGARDRTFSLLPEHVGKRVRVRVAARHPDYTDVRPYTRPTEPVAPGTVTEVERPVITGTPQVGETLRVTDGQWDPSDVTLRFQWFVDGERVVGARDRTFSLLPEHVGKRVRVRVAARHPDYTDVRPYTRPTEPVAPGTITEIERPTLAGETVAGETLTLDTGEFSPKPDELKIRWRADGETIDGATTTTLPVTEEYVGSRISARIVARKDGYVKHPRVTPRIDWIRAGHVTLAEPGKLRGRPRVGWRLAARPGVPEPAEGAVTSYQWLRDGAPIPGATNRRYWLTEADFRREVGVRIDYSHPDRYSATEEFTKPVRIRAGVKLSTQVGYRGRTRRGVLVIVDAVAPKVDVTVTGRIAVRLAGRVERANLEDGSARLVFPWVPYGDYTARVRLARDFPFYGAKQRVPVHVQRP